MVYDLQLMACGPWSVTRGLCWQHTLIHLEPVAEQAFAKEAFAEQVGELRCRHEGLKPP